MFSFKRTFGFKAHIEIRWLFYNLYSLHFVYLFINKSDNYNNNDDINQENHGLWYKKVFRIIVFNIVMTV